LVYIINFFRHTALTDYRVLQWSMIVYANRYKYLMMAVCGRNTSLNLHESIDEVVIPRVKLHWRERESVCVCLFVYIWKVIGSGIEGRT
jgi:hypothetical protein